MKRSIRITAIPAMVFGLLLAGVLPAQADDGVPSPGPDDLTWAQIAELNLFPDSAVFGPGIATQRPGVRASFPCNIDTGDVYKRSSGGSYPYGTVGGKPRTWCVQTMARISMTTNLYKNVWWGYQKVAGPFTSTNYNSTSLQQTNVEVVCADLRATTFQMIVESSATWPSGGVGSANAWNSATLSCGTNP